MPITADTIDDDLFSNTDIKEQHKQNINNILQQVNHGDIHIAQPTVEIKGEKEVKTCKKKKKKDFVTSCYKKNQRNLCLRQAE